MVNCHPHMAPTMGTIKLVFVYVALRLVTHSASREMGYERRS